MMVVDHTCLCVRGALEIKHLTTYESLSNHVYMDLPLSEVAGYDTKRVLFSPLWNLWAL